eukprot:3732672-Rhodomonas_salina.1
MGCAVAENVWCYGARGSGIGLAREASTSCPAHTLAQYRYKLARPYAISEPARAISVPEHRWQREGKACARARRGGVVHQQKSKSVADIQKGVGR